MDGDASLDIGPEQADGLTDDGIGETGIPVERRIDGKSCSVDSLPRNVVSAFGFGVPKSRLERARLRSRFHDG